MNLLTEYELKGKLTMNTTRPKAPSDILLNCSVSVTWSKALCNLFKVHTSPEASGSESPPSAVRESGDVPEDWTDLLWFIYF